MLKILVPALLLSSLLAVTPAFALYGHDAALACENTPGCYIDYLDDGTLVILGPEGGVVYCPAPADHKPCFVHSSKSKPRKAAIRMLQILGGVPEAAPDTTSGPTHPKKPPKVFNLNDGNDGNSGGKSGTPMGQGGKPVKNGGGSGGGKSVTPHNFIFVKPHPVG